VGSNYKLINNIKRNKMKDFAKTFSTKYGQILITNDDRETEDGETIPSVNAFFMISDDFGVCEVSIKFPSDKAEKCDLFFDDITCDIAIGMVEKTILAMR
jgi:hypothetical protein